MRDISDDAAIIADMIPWVKARFVEAVDTDEHVSTKLDRPPPVRSFWPASQSVGADTDPIPQVWRPDASAISRSHEVMHGWVLDFLEDEEQRRLVLAWASSLANPKRYGSFARFCKKSGRVRRTADRRLAQAFSIVAALIRKSGKSLQAPDMRRVSTLTRFSDREVDMVAEVVSQASFESHDGIGAWRADDAKPADLPEERDFSWAMDRSERRRQRTMANDA